MNFNKLSFLSLLCLVLFSSCNKDDDAYIGTWTLSSCDVTKITTITNNNSGETTSDESIIGVGEDIDYTITLSATSFSSDGDMNLNVTGTDLDGPISEVENYSITDNNGTVRRIGQQLTFLPDVSVVGLDPLLALSITYSYEVKNEQLFLTLNTETDTPVLGINTYFKQDLEYVFDKQ